MYKPIPPQGPEGEKPDDYNAILLGGVVIMAISLVPYLSLLNSLCCLGIMLGGFTSVYHYTSSYKLTILSGEGFKLGSLAGVLGGLASLVISYTLQLVFSYQPGSELLELMHDLQIQMAQGDPDVIAELDALYQKASEVELTVVQMIFGTIVTVTIDALFSGIGGAIGTSFFKYGNREKSYPDA
ncbi:hypothetical protein [Chloroherpeton thalassium]|nr:hypothetical protein [Chloroherpeton thalassium]